MRINILNPKVLADQHLVAEYREMKMLPKCFIRSLESKKGIDPKRISESYTLNTGHGYFFYDKFNFIEKRFESIIQEMHFRRFQTNFDTLDLSSIPPHCFGDYFPTFEEKTINLERILLRISDKPDWYKFRGKEVLDWETFYFHNILSI